MRAGRGADEGEAEKGGGVFISLEEMERKEAEKLAEAQAEEARLQAEAEKRHRSFSASETYWAYNLYVLGAGPAMMALWTLLTAPFVIHARATCSAIQMRAFVILSMLIAYVYLFVYTWMLMGPIPFKSRMRPLKIIFGTIWVTSLGVYGLGAGFVFGKTQCADLAPEEYRHCQIQLILYAIGSTSAVSKFVKEKWQERALKARQERRRKLKERIAKEMEAPENDDEDDDDDGDDQDDKNGSPTDDGGDDGDADNEEDGDSKDDEEESDGEEEEEEGDNVSGDKEDKR